MRPAASPGHRVRRLPRLCMTRIISGDKTGANQGISSEFCMYCFYSYSNDRRTILSKTKDCKSRSCLQRHPRVNKSVEKAEDKRECRREKGKLKNQDKVLHTALHRVSTKHFKAYPTGYPQANTLNLKWFIELSTVFSTPIVYYC